MGSLLHSVPCTSQDVQNHEASFWTAEEIDLAQNSKVHPKTCSLLIEQYIRDPTEKDKVLNAFHPMPAIQQKAQWAMQWMNDEMQ